jgi:hypothetical protein
MKHDTTNPNDNSKGGKDRSSPSPTWTSNWRETIARVVEVRDLGRYFSARKAEEGQGKKQDHQYVAIGVESRTDWIIISDRYS